MKKLTADKCREQIEECRALKERGYLSINGEYKLQALEIALPVLEQQEKECQRCDGSGAMDSGTEMWGDTVYVDCD